MTDDVKICPECKAEYYAYIESCAECEVELVQPPTYSGGPAQTSAQSTETPEGDGLGDIPKACIAEGAMEKLLEIVQVCEARGIPYEVAPHDAGDDCSSESCGPSSCGTTATYGLFVPKELAAGIMRAMEEQATSDPETREARERMEQGLCPACGATNMREDLECSDCGLNLMGPAEGGGGGGCG